MSTPLTTVKTAIVLPIPRARVRAAAAANAGARRRRRTARRSEEGASMARAADEGEGARPKILYTVKYAIPRHPEASRWRPRAGGPGARWTWRVPRPHHPTQPPEPIA